MANTSLLPGSAVQLLLLELLDLLFERACRLLQHKMRRFAQNADLRNRRLAAKCVDGLQQGFQECFDAEVAFVASVCA